MPGKIKGLTPSLSSSLALDDGTPPVSTGKTLEVPFPKLPRTHLTSSHPHRALWIGAAGVGVAATGAILGAMGGSVQYTEPVKPAPLEVVHGTEVDTLSKGLGSAFDVLGPLGIDHTTAQKSVERISISVEVAEGVDQALDDDVSIHLQPHTRILASIDRGGITISSSPGLERVVDLGFDTHLTSVRYDFGDAKFVVEASGFGPDAWHQEAVAKAITERYGDKLPEALRKPGYDPRSDAELGEHLQAIVDMLRPPPSAKGPTGLSPSLRAPELSMSFQVPKDLETTLEDGATKVNVKAGTRIDTRVRMAGPASDLTLASLDVQVMGDPIVISEKGGRDAIKRMDLTGIHLSPGPQVSLDYSLGPEGLIDGLKALIVLTATAADPRVATHATIHSTKLEGARAGIQDKVDKELEPQLAELIRKHDKDVPGISMMKVFGVSALDQP